MSSSNKIKSLGASALLISSLHLAGCGGGGDGDSDGTTAPPTSNNNPTVSISGETEVTEGNELVISATASDSDGSIASYAWQHVSGPEVTLAGSDTANISFTAPELEDDAQLVLEVTVTDNEGATTSAQVTIELKRKVLTVTITGIVTDKPIKDSNVAVQIGDETFDVTADGDGKYSVEIEVDDSFANKLVRLVALGNTAINPEVEFISQLKSIATLVAQAGEDGELTKEENFGVNITNVSTSEFALIKRDNDEIEDEQALDNALLAVDADEKLRLAALIKIVVDNEAYELPEGVESTLELISNADDIDNFVNTVNSQDADLIEATKNDIKEDDDLVDESIGEISGQYVMLAPKYYNYNSSQVNFNNDGSGYFSTYNLDTSFTWQQQGGDIAISLTEPVKESCSFVSDDSGTEQEQCNYLVAMNMTVLLENEANRTVEFYEQYQTIAESSSEVVNTNENSSNLTLIAKEKTLTVNEQQLHGTWYVDRISRFDGFSEAVALNLQSGGTGTLVDNDKAPVAITWTIVGNQLQVTSEAEELSFNYAFWLVKDVVAGYQFVASLNAKDESTTRTASGLMIKDNSLTFERSELLGKWTIYQGYNVPQIDLHYDVYEDGLMNFNLDQNYRSWLVDSEGKFIRNNYFTDSGVQPICDRPDNSCPVYSEFSQQLLAKNNGLFYSYRKYRFFNYDGSERVENYSSHIREFSVSADYGVNKFAPYWLENNSGFDENGYPTNVNYITLYTPKEQAVESITIATTYNEELDKNEYTLTQQYQGTTTENSYTLAAGKMLFGTMKAEISGFDREYLTVCVYENTATCTAADQQNWYFDSAKAQEQVVVVRPTPAHPLDGAWQLAHEPTVIIVFLDGKWVHIQTRGNDDVDDAFLGYEVGDFSWDETTGRVTVSVIEDTNGSWGLSSDIVSPGTDNIRHIIYASVLADGDTIALAVDECADDYTGDKCGEGDAGYERFTYEMTRIYDPSKPHVGAYFEGSIANNDFFLSVLKSDGYFFEFEHTSEFEPGIAAGTYTVQGDPSGDPEVLNVTVDTYINQLEEPEYYDPYFVVKAQGNQLIWLDGDGFGVMQRITNIVEPVSFSEANIIGDYVFSFMDQGTITERVIEVRSDGTTSFDLDGTVREGTWSLELGSLKLTSPESSSQDATYGMIISPNTILENGYAVSAFSVTVPDYHPEEEDPSLHISVMGSMLKQ
ncbi:PKD domain-containing protein [Pseudoalteromonas sp. ZZD1]|uniref:PKD domain-containing protein n=1 Tax=Pseudoalteromonas sp. ZZD1 TaxID=3139395 RepID=UPI003BAD8C5B